MSDFIKKEKFSLAVLLLSFIFAAWAYPRMPEIVPTHWGINGEPDGFSSREFGAWFFPFLNLGLYVMLIVVPKIDPKKKNYAKFESSYRLIRTVMVVFLSLIYVAASLAGIGYDVDIGRVVPVLVSALIILIGNVIGRVKFNYFVGVRTPWTLANETVWKKTHLFASRSMVVGGLIALAASLFLEKQMLFAVFMTAILASSFVPVIYSYFVYQKEIRENNGE